MTASDVAFHCRKSVRWVYIAKSSGLLPASLKVGGSTRWRTRDIERFLHCESDDTVKKEQ